MRYHLTSYPGQRIPLSLEQILSPMPYPSDVDLDHSRSRFVALTGELCRTLNQAMPEPTSGEVMLVSLVIDDVAFDLVHDMDVDADTFLVECELGPPPQDEEALLGLLRANLQMLREERGSFGLRRDDDATLVTYGQYMLLAESHATALLAAMQAVVHRALAWRAGVSF